MTQKQENKLAMFNKVRALFTDVPAAWDTIDPIVVTLDKFDTIVSEIPAVQKVQAENVSMPYTAERSLQLEDIYTRTTDLVRRLRGFARFSNDVHLQKEIEVNFKELKRQNLGTLGVRTRILLELAESNQAAAAAFKITPAIITELRTAIDNVAPITENSDVAAGKRVAATATLKTLFSNATAQLLTLDGMVYSLVDDSDFVLRYEQARRTDDRRGRSRTAAPENPAASPATLNPDKL